VILDYSGHISVLACWKCLIVILPLLACMCQHTETVYFRVTAFS